MTMLNSFSFILSAVAAQLCKIYRICFMTQNNSERELFFMRILKYFKTRKLFIVCILLIITTLVNKLQKPDLQYELIAYFMCFFYSKIYKYVNQESPSIDKLLCANY